MHWGCFVRTPTPPLFGSEEATPGSHACVPVRALCGRVRRPGLPGALWCASPFLWPFCPSSFSAPSGLGSPLPGIFCLLFCCLFPLLLSLPRCMFLAFYAFRPRVPLVFALCSFFCPLLLFSLSPPCFSSLCVPCAPVVSLSGVLSFPASGILSLGAVQFSDHRRVFFVPSLLRCVHCALCCSLLLYAVLRFVLRLPPLRCCGLLRVVRCSFGSLSVCCAVPCPAVGCCCVLRRVFGFVVPLRCSRFGLLSRLGLLCCVLGCCAALCCLVLCCGALGCFFWPCMVLLPAVSCPRTLSLALGCCAFQHCVLSCLSVLCALCGVCFGVCVGGV